MAMLAALGQSAHIVADADAYVALALSLAHDEQRRRTFRGSCLAQRDMLFDRCDASAALSRHLEQIVEAHRAGR